MVVYNLIVQMIVGSELTPSQHGLRLIQTFTLNIIPSFVGIELPLIAFNLHARYQMVRFN